jgi:hypothetical protein
LAVGSGAGSVLAVGSGAGSGLAGDSGVAAAFAGGAGATLGGGIRGGSGLAAGTNAGSLLAVGAGPGLGVAAGLSLPASAVGGFSLIGVPQVRHLKNPPVGGILPSSIRYEALHFGQDTFIGAALYAFSNRWRSRRYLRYCVEIIA